MRTFQRDHRPPDIMIVDSRCFVVEITMKDSGEIYCTCSLSGEGRSTRGSACTAEPNECVTWKCREELAEVCAEEGDLSIVQIGAAVMNNKYWRGSNPWQKSFRWFQFETLDKEKLGLVTGMQIVEPRINLEVRRTECTS